MVMAAPSRSGCEDCCSRPFQTLSGFDSRGSSAVWSDYTRAVNRAWHPWLVLVRRAIAGIEAGKSEIHPCLSNWLNIMGRVAPQFMLKQMVKLMKPAADRHEEVEVLDG